MKESFALTADLHDTDWAGELRPSCVLRAMQNATNAQMHRYGMDPAQLLRSCGRAFLLSRLSMEIYHPVYAYESLCAYAWPCESKGCSFFRCGQLCRKGTVVAELSAVWAFVEMQEHRLLRVSDFDPPFACHPPHALQGNVRISFPKEMEVCGQYRVAYADVDLHRHMNNTNYPDLLMGYCPESETQRLRRIDIAFSKEAPLGEELHLYTAVLPEGERIFRTLRRDGEENIRAKLTFTHR